MNKPRCTCGYQAENAHDLEEHILASMHASPLRILDRHPSTSPDDESHFEARRNGGQR